MSQENSGSRHPDVSPTKTPTWAPWHFNLGDHWATVNYLITRSYILREEQQLSRFQHGVDYGARFVEMLALIDGPERSSVVLVDEPGTHEPDGFDVWASPAWPTKPRWSLLGNHQVCYQFDGVSSAESKNPSPQDLDRILEAIGTDGIRLGNHQTLTDIVALLSKSSLFVGVDSGMSHIAHSVGVPVLIVEYGLPVITCHRGKHFKLARGTDELLTAIRSL